MRTVFKVTGLMLLYLSAVVVTIGIYTKLEYYYSDYQVSLRKSTEHMNTIDVHAEVSEAIAAGDYGFIGFTTGFGTRLGSIYCPDIEYKDFEWRRYVGHGDFIVNADYQTASIRYSGAYNRALITHPDSPYLGRCGLRERRCDWDESEGGLRGCEVVELPIESN